MHWPWAEENQGLSTQTKRSNSLFHRNLMGSELPASIEKIPQVPSRCITPDRYLKSSGPEQGAELKKDINLFTTVAGVASRQIVPATQTTDAGGFKARQLNETLSQQQ